MSFDVGFNFRGSSGYVTDGAGETYVIDSDDYPTTRGGATFGEEDEWLLNLDRDSGLDRRLAGMKAESAANSARFRVDLPATGDYDIHLAIGDPASGQNCDLATKDGTTTLDTYTVTTSGAAHFFDATGVQRTSSADWVSNEAKVTRTFATTIFRVQVNGAANTSSIAHARLVQVEAASGNRRRRLLLCGRN